MKNSLEVQLSFAHFGRIVDQPEPEIGLVLTSV